MGVFGTAASSLTSTVLTLSICYDISFHSVICDASLLHCLTSECMMILFCHCIMLLQTFVSDASPSLSKSKVLSSEGSTSGVPSPVTQVKGKEHNKEECLNSSSFKDLLISYVASGRD